MGFRNRKFQSLSDSVSITHTQTDTDTDTQRKQRGDPLSFCLALDSSDVEVSTYFKQIPCRKCFPLFFLSTIFILTSFWLPINKEWVSLFLAHLIYLIAIVISTFDLKISHLRYSSSKINFLRHFLVVGCKYVIV